MKRNVVTIVIVILFLAVMIFYGTRGARNAKEAGSVSGETLRADNIKGQLAPDFTLNSVEGKPIKLSDYRGKAVVLNFWATWCGPCKVEMPWLIDLQNKYRSEGVEIVGVSMDDGNKDAVAKFAKEMGVNYTVLLGKESVGDAYGGMVGLPTTFYIDRNGKITNSVAGLISKGEIEDNIKAAMGGATQGAKS